MTFRACQLSLILAAAIAAPAAVASSDIVKCIDRNGHVTLTDQPCAAGSVTQRVDTTPAMTTEPAGASGYGQTQSSPPQSQPVERYVAPRAIPKRGKWRPPKARETPLARDIATLKQARLQLLMKDEARQQQLAVAD